MALQVVILSTYKSDFWFNRLPSGSNMGRMVLTQTWRLELGTNRSENISQQVSSFSSFQKIPLQKLHHFQPVRKYISILSLIIFFFQAAGVNMFFFIEKLRSYVPDFIITQPTFGYPQVSFKVNGSGGKWCFKRETNLAVMLTYHRTQQTTL